MIKTALMVAAFLGCLAVGIINSISTEVGVVRSKWGLYSPKVLVQIRDTGPSYMVRVSRNAFAETFEGDSMLITFFGETPMVVTRKDDDE